MCLRHPHGVDTGVRATSLVAISQWVVRASGRPVGANKSIVGEAVFTHESGIHVDGLLKHPGTYESFDPAELGRERRTVLGKHPGSHAVRAAYQTLGLPLVSVELGPLIDRIRDYAMLAKRAPPRPSCSASTSKRPSPRGPVMKRDDAFVLGTVGAAKSTNRAVFMG